MDKVAKAVDSVFIAVGFSFGLQEIETVLGIIILSLQILWISCKFIKLLIKKAKAKKFDEIGDVIKETIDEFKEIKGDDVNE